jgi:hypothetical protein
MPIIKRDIVILEPALIRLGFLALGLGLHA